MCPPLDKIRGLSAYKILEQFYKKGQIPIDLQDIFNNIGLSAKSLDFTEIEKNSNIEKGSILGVVVADKNNAAIFY